MAQAGFTPIQLYFSTTAAAVPLAANLAQGELAINIVDGKLYYENNSGVVTLLASTEGASGDVVGPASATANGIALFNSTTGKLIKDSAASDGLIYGLTVGRGLAGVSTNTAVGASALAANTTGNLNTALGFEALKANLDGAENVAVGYRALDANTSGTNNIAMGRNALGANISGSANVAVGDSALLANTTANSNSAFGDGALTTNSTGASNVAVGRSALGLNTTASNNTAVGYQAGYANTTGEITAIGSIALTANTTGEQNTAVGYVALTLNTTGSYNTGVGRNAIRLNTTGSYNTGLGHSSLYNNTTAVNNTAVGYQAGYNTTTGTANTFVGYQAGFNNTIGQLNVHVGFQAGYTSNSAGGYSSNVLVGPYTGYLVTTGVNNTFVGAVDSTGNYSAGQAMTTGSRNTILGAYSGNNGGLDIRTANNYIVLSDGDGNPRMYSDGSGVLYDQNGKLRAVPQSGSSKTSSYTLATTDVGEYILLGASGAIVIPDATFAAGDVVTIFNNTASTATITCSITTAYIAGTFTDKATMTLAAAGVATVLFITSTLCVVSGNVT
jgi:hypothetical protein